MTVPVRPGLMRARVPRLEDPRLLRGRGQYVDDVRLPGMLHMAVLRSPHAHARIRRVDVSAARALPGVFAVLTGADVARVAQPQPCIWMLPNQRSTEAYALAVDRVRYVGEGVAVVAAADRYAAEDALEAIAVDYEPLPVVADLEAALAPGAPTLYDGWADNVTGRCEYAIGDPDAALRDGDVVVRHRFTVGRQLGCPLETRGCVASWDAYTGDLELYTSTQSPHQIRELLGEVLGLPEHKIRVRVPDVGGGFGNKFHFYAEEVLAALLSRQTGRPVKYIEDRRESFLATTHARHQVLDVAVSATRDGVITGLSGTVVGDMGAHNHTVGMGPVWLSAVMLTGAYRIRNARATGIGVMTNKVPYGSYRGWGQPKANFAIERLVELVARRLGLDGNEVRRRNFVRPDEFPYTGLVHTYDSGRYAECLDLCVKAVREQGWYEQQAEARRQGRSVGIGYAFHVENTAFGPTRPLNMGGVTQGGYDAEVVRMDASGRVTVFTGLSALGQGIQTALAQVCADELGVPLDYVTVVVGDTATCPYTGYGTGASRAASVGGAAVKLAAAELKRKVLAIAGHMLEAAPEDLEIVDGRISVKGAPGLSVTTKDVGYAAYRFPLGRVPEGMDLTLEARCVFDPPAMAWSYGHTAVMLEVDRATGQVKLLNYLIAHDCGTVINPTIVEGQLMGGATQGIAGALFEEILYDAQGQLQTASFLDYLLPTAAEVPAFQMLHLETESPFIPGGMKGVGEGGTIGAPAAVANAIDDALSDLGITITDLPVTPARLRALIEPAEGAEA